MRSGLVLPAILSSFLILGGGLGCGGGGGGGDDDPDQPDAGGDPPPPEHGFQIVTPDITIMPGEEVTYCYFTTIDVDQVVGVKRWTSTMTPGSHHLILFATPSEQQPDGTITRDCGFGGGGLNLPVWTYSAQTPEAAMAMPAGVGMRINARQKVFVQMHYFNASPNAIDAHVVINGETYPEGETYEPASAYVTYNTRIDIPAGQTGTASGTCAVSSTVNFFTMSTHSHRFSTRTEVRDGSTVVFESTDWEHPGATDWRAPPHYRFSSGAITYHCEYNNTSGARVRTGDSAETDEMCMAVGYMFPASQPRFCIDSLPL